VITLRVADLAGNVTTTNFTVTLDFSTDAEAPTLELRWPTNDMHLSGDSFYIRGRINDETASLAAEWVAKVCHRQSVGVACNFWSRLASAAGNSYAGNSVRVTHFTAAQSSGCGSPWAS
jgi:hypothetical protein